MTDWAKRRRAAGVSQVAAAVRAGVSPPTLRVFEINPEAVTDERKRAQLVEVYEAFPAAAPSAESRR